MTITFTAKDLNLNGKNVTPGRNDREQLAIMMKTRLGLSNKEGS